MERFKDIKGEGRKVRDNPLTGRGAKTNSRNRLRGQKVSGDP